MAQDGAVADLDLLTPTDEEGVGDGDINPQILSGSSVNTYLRCQKQWEFAYVLQLKRPPSIKQGLGIAAHSAVELNMEQKILTYLDLPPEAIVQRFVDEFDGMAPSMEDPPALKPDGSKSRKETKAQARESGRAAVALHHEAAGSKIQPVWVERQIQFKINGVDYSGIVDLVDDRDRVRDWKFVSRRPESGGTYLLSMIGYALGFRHAEGRTEADVVLDHIVRTKEPYYLPLASDGPVTDRAISEFANIVGTVKRSIDAGIFMPTGLQSYACSWCGYADICPAYRAAHGGRNA